MVFLSVAESKFSSLVPEVTQVTTVHKELFIKYGKCHRVLNANCVTKEDITLLGTSQMNVISTCDIIFFHLEHDIS